MKTTTALPRTTRLISLLVSLLMVASLAVVQAAPASAAAPGWARLVAGVNVLPGSAQYAVQVETQTTAVNTVVVAVPAGIGVAATDVVGVTVPGGAELDFNGTVQTVGSFQRIIFTAPEGVSIPANSNAVLRFNADISPPAAATERSGTFKVQLSSDGGDSFEVATTGARDPRTGGTLTTTIKFLEVLAVDIVGPQGVTDLTGTEGQDIAVRTTVLNYAQIPVSVTAGLNSSSPRGFASDESISEPVALQLLPNTPTTADFDVRLGTAVNTDGDAVDRSVTFSGSVVEDLTGATGFGASSDDFTVQVLGRIVFDGGSFDPRIVSPGAATFVVNATHSGTPAFDVALGAADISFAETRATNQEAFSFASGAEATTLSFTGQVIGEDDDHPVSSTYMATDENGYTYMQSIALTEAGLFGRVPVEVTIDALAPLITTVIGLPNDADGRQQSAAKDGDSITVSGTIDDDGAEINEVRLVANGQLVAVKRTEDVNRQTLNNTYSVTFSGEEVKFPGGLGQFVAVTAGADSAGNLGVGFSGAVDFDNVVPRLTAARVESTIDLNQSLLGQVGSEPGVISVRFAENSLIRGGCNANQYTVDGQNVVREVRMSDNSPCFSGSSSDDNDRLLILSVPIERESTPLVRYSPIPGDRISDFAGNLAPEDTVTAVSGIVPVAPDLLDVFRNTANKTPEECQADNDACEDAFQEGTGANAVYWTRFDGNDTVVCVAGARPGYSVEVTDENDNTILGTRQPTADTTPCVRVPIGSDDTTYVRGIRFRNSAGAGEVLNLNIALDTVLPEIADVTRNGDTITVGFNDQLVEGNNSSLNWLVYERLADGSEVAGPPNSVTTPSDTFGGSDQTQRVLTGSFEENGDYIGIGYVFFSGTRYGDRGGNKLLNVPGPRA